MSGNPNNKEIVSSNNDQRYIAHDKSIKNPRLL